MVNYYKYMKSEGWAKKSLKWRSEEPFCEKCKTGFNLTIHHKHYRTLGFEARKDVIVLCWTCHKKYDTLKPKILTKKLEIARINYIKEKLLKTRTCVNCYKNKKYHKKRCISYRKDGFCQHKICNFCERMLKTKSKDKIYRKNGVIKINKFNNQNQRTDLVTRVGNLKVY